MEMMSERSGDERAAERGRRTQQVKRRMFEERWERAFGVVRWRSEPPVDRYLKDRLSRHTPTDSERDES